MPRPGFLYWYAAAAKSLQLCPTLCDSIDGSPPGSAVPGILQARTLEWVARGAEAGPRVGGPAPGEDPAPVLPRGLCLHTPLWSAGIPRAPPGGIQPRPFLSPPASDPLARSWPTCFYPLVSFFATRTLSPGLRGWGQSSLPIPGGAPSTPDKANGFPVSQHLHRGGEAEDRSPSLPGPRDPKESGRAGGWAGTGPGPPAGMCWAAGFRPRGQSRQGPASET